MKKENPFKDWSEDALSHAVSMAVVSPHVKGETVDNMLEALAYRQGVEKTHCKHGWDIRNEGLCQYCELGEL